MKIFKPYVYAVKRRRAAPVRNVRTIHDSAKCIGMSDQVRAAPQLYSPYKAITAPAQGIGRGMGQGYVYDHAAVFGTGNPRTIGATGGERVFLAK